MNAPNVPWAFAGLAPSSFHRGSPYRRNANRTPLKPTSEHPPSGPQTLPKVLCSRYPARGRRRAARRGGYGRGQFSFRERKGALRRGSPPNLSTHAVQVYYVQLTYYLQLVICILGCPYVYRLIYMCMRTFACVYTYFYICIYNTCAFDEVKRI